MEQVTNWQMVGAVICFFIAWLALSGMVLATWFNMKRNNWSIKPVIAWYDCWIGIYIDQKKRKIYVLPLPCVGFCLEWPITPGTDSANGGDQK